MLFQQQIAISLFIYLTFEFKFELLWRAVIKLAAPWMLQVSVSYNARR